MSDLQSGEDLALPVAHHCSTNHPRFQWNLSHVFGAYAAVRSVVAATMIVVRMLAGSQHWKRSAFTS
jgi:hypothetical protein